MNRDEAIRTLLEQFGNQWFSVKDITDDWLQEIAELVGATTKTTHGMRVQIGKRLTEMAKNNYRCSTAPKVGATLKIKAIPEDVDPRPEVYQILYP